MPVGKYEAYDWNVQRVVGAGEPPPLTATGLLDAGDGDEEGLPPAAPPPPITGAGEDVGAGASEGGGGGGALTGDEGVELGAAGDEAPEPVPVPEPAPEPDPSPAPPSNLPAKHFSINGTSWPPVGVKLNT